MFTDYSQTNWVEHLPLVEFAINNNRSSTTQHSPFYLNYGQHPTTPDNQKVQSMNPAAQATVQELQATLTLVKDLMRNAQDRQAGYANVKREEKIFKVGDKVLLNTENITEDNQRQRPSRKLAPRFIGPFTIIACIGRVAYKLELPATLKIHPVFHVSRLKTYKEPISYDPRRETYERPPPILVNNEEQYEVEKILDKRTYRRQVQYLVKWQGYPDSDNTWIPLRDLDHACEAVQDFENQRQS